MKLAFVGKGGSGKTTLAALFSRHLASEGLRRWQSTPTSTSTSAGRSAWRSTG
jgi:adenylate kinase family enzyme